MPGRFSCPTLFVPALGHATVNSVQYGVTRYFSSQAWPHGLDGVVDITATKCNYFSAPGTTGRAARYLVTIVEVA